MNTKKSSWLSKTQTIRHAKSKGCHRIQHETLKLYSVIRSKSLIHVFFQHGVILSFDRILSFLNELSQTVRVLFNESDNKVLPSAFTTVVPIKGKVNATYAVETVSIPDAFREDLDTITHHELKNEDNWLEVACGDVEEGSLTQPTSWTAHHKSKACDRSENISTINVPLPLINYKSSAIELQYHLMKIAVEYTQHPGQIAVGCSDQPLYALKKTIQLQRLK